MCISARLHVVMVGERLKLCAKENSSHVDQEKSGKVVPV